MDFGDGWKCDRGFKRVEDKCQSVEVPEHTFLNRWGDGWECERGFKRVKDQCQVVQVPDTRFSAHGETAGSARGASRAPAIAVLRSDDP